MIGWVAAGAGITFGLSLLMLALFFVRHDARFDRVAEWSFVAFALMAIPTIVSVAGLFPDTGLVIGVATVVAVVGVAVVGLGELGSTLSLVEFRRIGPLVTLGFLAFLGWIGTVSVITLGGGRLPASLGWLGLGSIVLGILSVVWLVRLPGVTTGAKEPSPGQMAVFFVPMIGIVGWMIWLGFSL